ncbi:flavin reductase family protein [Enteractinococcus coprophilus]|uniref:Flavin reductase (DIM6/NTAB) family NADH-FMN oxidoreductase RutF n=1 Tax=Enteractinococcus coprophilus TaxID=1027633 RepID=A0A543AG59_9MICC|nr:flavin reductase [Enteractinococcus coprophilus]TQL71565.1 flavin reductase (DIM6/NTAB) family NADH-FMN oxidoreductase RutF [Enteractinococcus coprophilus]
MSNPFATLMSSENTSLIVVTTAAENVRAGCVVSYHTQASMKPQHYNIWLSKANHTYKIGLLAETFGVHFLTQDDLAWAEHFATMSGQDTDKFADLEVEMRQGVPLLTALPNRMVIEQISMLDDGGDHVCVTARVIEAESPGHFTPLRLSDIGDLRPAHDSSERIIQP